MWNRRCPPGQVSQGTPPRCVPASPIGRIPGQHSIGVVYLSPARQAVPGVPGGFLSPFSNAAGPAAPPAPAPPPFRFQYQGVLDSSGLEIVPLSFPFESLRPGVTQEIHFTLSSAYRDTAGGLGTDVWSQAANFGFSFQCSVGPAPDHIFLSVYSDWGGPVDPDSVNVTRTDYEADWPLGSEFTMRLTIDTNLVPHLYVDGVEVALVMSSSTPQVLTNGNKATVYGYSFVPGNTVDINPLVVLGAVVPPPAAV